MGGFFSSIQKRVAPSDAAWRGAIRGLFFLSVVVIGSMFYFDVIAHFWIGKLLGFLVLFAMILGIALLFPIVIWFLKGPPTTFKVVFLIALLPVLSISTLFWGAPQGLLPAFAVTILVALLSGSLASLRQSGRNLRGQVPALTGLGIAAAGLAAGSWVFFNPVSDPNPWIADIALEDRTLDLPDPSLTGPYQIGTFTYGSGSDLHRREFADGVKYKTETVDGSKLVDHWEGAVGWIRTKFWGFDPKTLPIQGRVWMPRGEGPFPLLLIVHGNHGMEKFSDPGYGYLGELFASRGIITVSVDQNFLNSSSANMIYPPEAGIGEENDARGWLLLKHLQQWRTWNSRSDHDLFGKVDMENLALMGHSRGGEAVAVAAVFNPLTHYPDNAAEIFDFDFSLKGIIAIAPVDGQYEPRDKSKSLTDINYLVIHGSMDGDVSSFMGASQMSRVSFSDGGDFLKAGVYVTGANHGQFNTSWGIRDFGLPYDALSNLEAIMDPEDQRQIAKVYFSSFLEVIFNRNKLYLPVLGDPRRGAAWLPQAHILTNLITSKRTLIAGFDEDMELTSGTKADVDISGRHLTRWREEWVSLKWKPLDTHVVILAWDRDVDKETATYEISWGKNDLLERDSIVFSLASLQEGTKPLGWADEEEPEGGKDDKNKDEDKVEPLDWTLVATDALGNEASLPLSHDSPLYPQVKAHLRKIEGFGPGAQSELVWRRFEFPIADFRIDNSNFEPSKLISISFVFDKSEHGAIALDDFGIE
jgi:dienelactone hydrolase